MAERTIRHGTFRLHSKDVKMAFYRIKGLCKNLLDGLFVNGHVEGDYVWFDALFDMNSIFGDRNVKLPIPGFAMLVHKDYLDEVDDPGKREYASDNPYGKFMFESRHEKGNIVVAASRFENAVQVNVYEKSPEGKTKTLYAENFRTECFDPISFDVSSHFSGDGDVDDLIFELKQTKEDFDG